MITDKRKALPEGYELTILEETNKTPCPVVIYEEIGRGGTCIVYKGERQEAINGVLKNRSVIVKEFYPSGLEIARSENQKLDLTGLDIQGIELYKKLQEHFGEGQANSVDFYDYYKDQSLPRPFIYGESNNTVYAVSDPSKGKTLSEIPFDDLSLDRVASIMESICDAISKIHAKRMLYLDCKPDNFFYYYRNKDLQAKVYLFDFDTIVSIDDIQSGNYTFCSASKGWIPPEQFLTRGGYRDPQHIGYHTDIFSVGAIFFWLLTQRKPTDRDLRAIQEEKFDWETESRLCRGEDKETIDLIQDTLQSMLQIETEDRQEMFRHYLSIKIIKKQFECLYGLTCGKNVHFIPLHKKLERIEYILNSCTEQISSISPKLDDILDLIENSTNSKLDDILELGDETNSKLDDILEAIRRNRKKTTIKDTVRGILLDSESGKPKKVVICSIVAVIVLCSFALLLVNTHERNVKNQASWLKDLFLSDSEGNGWGDSASGRSSYSIEEINTDILGKSVTFNSASDGRVGNEKNFVAAKDALNNEEQWSADTLPIEDGGKYTICLYVNNDNPNGEETVAQDVHAFFEVPTNISNEHLITGFIKSQNSMMARYWDNVALVSEEPVYLEYVNDSAAYTNYKKGRVQLDNDVTKEGVSLGYKTLDGKIPGGYSYCGIVTIDVVAHKKETATIALKTRLKGTKEWKKVINANLGDEVEYQIEYQNLSADTVDDIMIRDILPDNVEYVNDSTYLYNTNHPDGMHLDENSIATTGINIGSYNPEGNAFVRFTGKVVDNSLEEGVNQLVNWASSTNWKTDENYELYKDDASVMVNK